MYLVFEGPDGSGKSSMLEMLYTDVRRFDLHNDKPIDLYKLHQPGSTQLGEELRSLCKNPKVRAGSLAQFFCMAADHSQFVEEKLRHYGIDNLHSDETLLLQDRHSAISGFVYQVAGNGVDDGTYQTTYTDIMGGPGDEGLYPDLVILCKTRLDTILKRIKKRGGKSDRYENRDFLKKVVRGYDWVLTDGIIDEDRYLIIDSNCDRLSQYKAVLRGINKHPRTKDRLIGNIARQLLKDRK